MGTEIEESGEQCEETLPAGVEEALNQVCISKDIKKFFREIDGLVNTLPLTMLLLNVEARRSRDNLAKYFDANDIKGNNGQTYTKFINVTKETIGQFRKLEKRNAKATLAIRIIPQSFLVSLISQYDSFIGTLIKSFYYLKPELLNASGKQLTFSELRRLGSIEAASEHIVEKEVDLVMRGSHIDQIDWLSKFSGIELRKELKSWKVFVEITERRNLFVHTGGKISQQYFDICKEHGIDISKLTKGQQLGASAKYFLKAYETVLEIGLIIAQAIWRKLLPTEREDADRSLNDICVDLIGEQRYRLACTILDHVIEEFKHCISTEEHQLMMFINRAQAYKWNGEKEKASKILSKHDWSAKSIEFKLAVAILMDNFGEAYRLMRIIGITGTPSQQQYRDWPLFREICNEQEFLDVYEEIFKEPFGGMEEKTNPEGSLFDIMGSQKSLEALEQMEQGELA
jgi:hypothetical protein